MNDHVSITFNNALYQWYDLNFRDLPWRKTNDPYLIWVSEVIMQQTQVKQGLPYYFSFIEAFPSVIHLANASEDDVLALWKGLGYYSRARNMHKAAKFVRDQLSGVFPSSYKDLLLLSGVGSYSAAAIASFSVNEPVGVLDGNVFRFFGRFFGIDTAINTPQGKRTFNALVDSVLDRDNPAKFNQAIMEFGALQCTNANPNCLLCPFVNGCFAYINGCVKGLPVKKAASKKRHRFLNFLLIRVKDGFVVERRGDGDIWANLYQLPLLELDNSYCKSSDWITNLKLSHSDDCLSMISIAKSSSDKHILSHQLLTINFYLLTADSSVLDEILHSNSTFSVLPYQDFETKAFPVPIYRFLQSTFGDAMK